MQSKAGIVNYCCYCSIIPPCIDMLRCWLVGQLIRPGVVDDDSEDKVSEDVLKKLGVLR